MSTVLRRRQKATLPVPSPPPYYPTLIQVEDDEGKEEEEDKKKEKEDDTPSLVLPSVCVPLMPPNEAHPLLRFRIDHSIPHTHHSSAQMKSLLSILTLAAFAASMGQPEDQSVSAAAFRTAHPNNVVKTLEKDVQARGVSLIGWWLVEGRGDGIVIGPLVSWRWREDGERHLRLYWTREEARQ